MMLKAGIFYASIFFSALIFGQSIDKIKYADLEKLIDQTSEELTVVNFWATWCGPCIKEMPHFDQLDESSKIKVYFVSLDFPQELDKVEMFLKKRSINAQTFWLDENDADSYLRQVSDTWSGAIPATLFVDRNKKRHFFERSFSSEELKASAKEFLENQ
jgi:thiol-disulfide isomerase/thioredoxin